MLQIIKQWEPGKVFWGFWTLVAGAVSVLYAWVAYGLIGSIANDTGSKQVLACLLVGVAVVGLVVSWCITANMAYTYSKVPPWHLRFTLGDVILFCRMRLRVGYRFRKWIESPSGAMVWYGFFLLWWIVLGVSAVHSYISVQSTVVSPYWVWLLLMILAGVWALAALWFVALNLREFVRALVRFVVDVVDKHRQEKARDPKDRQRQAFAELQIILDMDECDEDCDCNCEGAGDDGHVETPPATSQTAAEESLDALRERLFHTESPEAPHWKEVA